MEHEMYFYVAISGYSFDSIKKINMRNAFKNNVKKELKSILVKTSLWFVK